jgi:catechol 2,3-dioxygenase-like lactoylglutathione lyase family enzyme
MSARQQQNGGHIMGLKPSHCSQFVRDQDEALAFYRDVIGLEVRLDAPLGDGRWLTMGPPGQSDIEIMIETPFHIDDPEDEKTLRFSQPLSS